MAVVTQFGNIRSVKVFDGDKIGEIKIRTIHGIIRLKLPDENQSSFLGMVAMASTAIAFGNAETHATEPNVHVTYDDGDWVIDDMTFHWHDD